MTGLPRVEPLGDSALLVVLGEGTDPQLLARVAGLVERIGRADLAGVDDIVPAYGSVAVFFDPLAQDGDALAAQLARAAQEAETHAPSSPRTTHVLPVRYDGPDLADVAERTGLSPAEVVRRHSEADYGVHFLGFAPGFAYLGPLDPSLVLPRRTEPRRRVPPGSVAIAGAQTGVYPLETPGGWHLIGRTEVPLFDPARDPPNLLAAGDRVRFSPVE